MSENQEYGTCFYCGDFCNINSQACGRCLRKISTGTHPTMIKNSLKIKILIILI